MKPKKPKKVKAVDLIPKSTKEYLEAVDNPWGKFAVIPHIPLAENGMPCTSNTFSIYGATEHTVGSGVSVLDFWFYPEGVPTVEVDSSEYTYPQLTTTTTNVPLGPPKAGNPLACAGIFAEAADINTNQAMYPNVPTHAQILSYDTNVSAELPVQRGLAGQACDMARLVGFSVRVGFVGRQVDIEGTLESLCLFEEPGQIAGLPGDFDQYRSTATYQRQTFSAKRFARWDFKPNCETPLYRACRDTAVAITSYETRMRGRLIDLAPGDKIRIEYIGLFEVNRRLASRGQIPAPISSQATELSNAIMTSGTSGGKLAAHHVAHLVSQHPAFSQHTQILHHAAEVIGGTAAAGGLYAAIAGFLAETPVAAALLAPLMLGIPA
jgi:hypothetical protein